MNDVCICFGKTRQGYYKSEKRNEQSIFEESIVIQLVQEKRKLLPKVGGRKLLFMLREDFLRLGFKIGRDKFFDLLRQNDLLIKNKRKYAKTTNSKHWFRRHKNLIKDVKIISPNQVFVSDITYLRVSGSFLYLSLITDYYSRKIVGYAVSKSLSVEGSLSALKMALKEVKESDRVIHHSDRGIQYCCHEYTKLLDKKKIRISMTEEDHVYENAVAERVNGILKTEFMLGETFTAEDILYQAVDEGIKLYNELRPHLSLNYLTPEQKYAA